MNFDPFEKFEFSFDDDGWFSSCRISKKVETCPCCNSVLYADATGWEEDDSGFYFPVEIDISCVRDMTEEMECYAENKDSQIWRMPYVYWLPVEEHCKRWITKMLRIYYKLDEVPKRWLELNGQINLFGVFGKLG